MYIHIYIYIHTSWLVVWNMFPYIGQYSFPIYFYMFQRGKYTINQKHVYASVCGDFLKSQDPDSIDSWMVHAGNPMDYLGVPFSQENSILFDHGHWYRYSFPVQVSIPDLHIFQRSRYATN